MKPILSLALIILLSESIVGFVNMGLKAPNLRRSEVSMIDLDGISASTVALVGLGGLGIGAFVSYSKIAVETAGVISGIPVESDVVEFNAVDGKNVFYLPPGCDYTAVMPIEEVDTEKKKQKSQLNEQLILESVGKANGMGPGGRPMGLRGKVRMSTSEIPNRSADVVLSTGAVGRCATENRGMTVNEAVRVLRPGGLFVFIERQDCGIEALVENFFPQDVSAGKVIGGSANTAAIGGGRGRRGREKKKMGRRAKARAQNQVEERGYPCEEEEEEESREPREGEGEIVVVDTQGTTDRPKRAQAVFKQTINLGFSSYVVGIATKRTSS